MRDRRAVATGDRVPMMATSPAPMNTMALLLNTTDTGWLRAAGTIVLKYLELLIDQGSIFQGSPANVQ
jgi:hypothetical protein